MSLLVLSLAVSVPAAEGKSVPEEKPDPAGPEVTLKGMLMLEEACTLKPAKDADKTMVLFALEGTPEVTATLDAIMKEYWPGDSMDGNQARDLNDAFAKRLKYYFTPCELTMKNLGSCKWGNPQMAVTGIVSEKDGKQWITPSKIFGEYPNKRPVTLKYPDKMLALDKPIKMTGKEPLILKVTDTLSLKCILLPSGKFLFAKPFYVAPRWQDEFPRLITLTKPFWLAEIPVTQEMYEAVMGSNPSTLKDPQRPVRNVPCADVNKFCKIVSEKSGRTVRLPGEAEWEYAARVGTSNPPLDVKYKDQKSSGGARGECLPVKSKQPNAWGLYDMISDNAYEMTRDAFVFRRMDEVDPYYSCEKDEASGKKHGHWGRNTVTYHEAVGEATNDAAYGSTKFRVVVDATPEEIAEMEKAEKK
ncbi:MAG: SUMF1/EgtB/PvdO family nonheme iron enzyme [Planctomycetota bacterium]